MGPQAPTGPWLYLTPLIALAVIVLRNRRARRLRVERLWISPVVLILLAVLIFAVQPPPGPVFLAIDLAAMALGAFVGWWRGRFTNISVDPATHQLASRPSAAGMILILVLFGVRYALRMLTPETAGFLHVSALEITSGLMLLAVGLVCAQRLEIFVRARRLLREARATTFA
jgi:hypothetical protein